jgi:hypothetical protein
LTDSRSGMVSRPWKIMLGSEIRAFEQMPRTAIACVTHKVHAL